MFVHALDWPETSERAVLVQLDTGDRSARSGMAELYELAVSAGASPVAKVFGKRKRPDSQYFIGSGKAEEVHSAIAREKADLVLFNHSLTPSQERNLARLFQCRILDRTELILEIFARRAQSHEGKLQVELARLRYMSTRLVRGWTTWRDRREALGFAAVPARLSWKLIGGKLLSVLSISKAA